ncbi:NADH:flavin oxidoreductase/NADH oxidase [Alicyclobacillus fastidiosus]|uniref:NADH:flavin oxidoreductase/NADH oxidase n=1 Tax=Alicyclobacillus fastidiosus TaxID=392011 RepID=A0ABV5AIV7_9BACL|nr:NADH:flavin oxidoreductase/NADH oxidase [Alicyclobacillus fastidiosus]WEH08130.1 NADH:flavin oxidoreductase/NADH oxidase [Alicyclobacillus fastidiosus]
MAGLFDPLVIRGLTLNNRIVVSPMCQYQAETNGHINDWHVVHYGSLALAGASLLFVESTAVEDRGRISSRDVGLYEDGQIEGLRRIVQFAHAQGVHMGVQLNHAGRKADLDDDIISPSAVAFSDRYRTPREMAPADFANVVEAFQQSARRAVAAGFDVIEIHAAHGYLLHQFLSPLSNRRQDAYGGDADGRLRFPLEVVRAVRGVIPEDMPLFVRVSASDYHPDGLSSDDLRYFTRAFRDAGVSLVDVSSGGNIPAAPPKVYAGYQIPLAESIRSHVDDVLIGGVGMLDDPVLADSMVQSNRADLIFIARGFLRNKNWGQDAAIALGQPVRPPAPYARAYPTSQA